MSQENVALRHTLAAVEKSRENEAKMTEASIGKYLNVALKCRIVTLWKQRTNPPPH